MKETIILIKNIVYLENPDTMLHMKNPKIFTITMVNCFTILALMTVLPVLAQQSIPRQTIALDTGWRFHLGHAADPSRDFNFSIANIFAKSGKAENCAIDPKFDDHEWRKVTLPHDWAVELPFVRSENADVMAHGYKPVGGLFPETSIGWYRKHFRVSPADSGKRFFVRFDGIYRNAKIWLNGFYLGTNESGYIGVSYDVTDYIDFHNQNTVVVRVDATQYEGWFYEGAGIYRHVWLSVTDEIHVIDNGLFVYSEVKDGVANITCEINIRNDQFAHATFEISSLVTDQNGRILSKTEEQSVFIKNRTTTIINQQLTLKNPRLWQLEDPYLYRAAVVIKQKHRVTDSVGIRFGVRTIRFDPETGFYLNGSNIKIFGVNCHQDHAGAGSALPDFLQFYRIRLLKEMGVNAYRTSHNAPVPELLDACDSLGMLVLDEQRLLNSSPEYIDQFDRLIRRDRNHPSVFLWSIGNEEGMIQTTGFGKRIAQSLIDLQKQLDPTRTCTYAADLPNFYSGINEVIPIRSFNYRQFAVAEYHKSHPEQPILGTEMGSTVTTRGINEKDTINCYLPDQDITAPWWASTAEEWWKLCADQPWWMGGFIWTGFDYRGEPTPFGWPNINSHFGVMDMCGFPKNLYYYYQSWWTNNDVLHISPHWNWNGKVKEGQLIRVWINSNADDVELFLNGKSFGKKVMPRNSHLSWEVPYQPGKLEAVANKNGIRLIKSVETTGKPYRLILSPYKNQMMADGMDANVLNVTVADSLGREVPDAKNLVYFSLKGKARFIGVGNGDPSSHEADKCSEGQWQRKLFNGKCQIIMQSGFEPENVDVIAESDGIKPARIILVIAD